MTDTTARQRATIKDEIRDILEKSRRVLVVSHVDPDGDALGTQLAMANYLEALGKTVYRVEDSRTPEKYEFLPDVDKLLRSEDLPGDFDIDTAVVLECPNRDRVDAPAEFLDRAEHIVNIDHHRNSKQLGTVNWIDITYSSVGEMTAEYLQYVDFRMTEAIATQLYTAILTDTGRFRYSSTSPQTMRIVGDLIDAGADPREICDEVYYRLRPSTMKLVGKVLETIEFCHDNRFCLLTMTNRMLEEAGADRSESDGLVDFTLYSRGVQAGALLKEGDEGETKVSLRSVDGVNVARIAEEWGGGGHYNAAGCSMPLDLESAKKALIDKFEEAARDAQ